MLRRPIARRAVGTMATTAVVAGTATAVSGRVARRQASKAREEAAAAAPMAPPASAEPAYAEPAVAAPAPAITPELVEQLTQLAALKDQGILTEEEFAAQKARLLAT
jgi:hypothetical protein